MKYLFFFLTFFLSFSFLNAQNSQDTARQQSFWASGGQINTTFQQVGTSNWAGGGQSSLALGGVLSTFLVYDDTTRHRWENNLEVMYGISRIGGREERFAKTKDNLILTSRYGRRLSKHYYLTSLLDFRSQVAQGFRLVQVNDSISDPVLISRFMSPGFLVASLGLTYSPRQRKLIEEEKKISKREGNFFAITLAPFSGKFTFVLNERLAEIDRYGTDGKWVRAEAGSSITVGIRRKVLENVIFSSNLNLFSAFETYQNVDVNLESLLILKVNKYIMSNISVQLIYDDDLDVRRDDGTVGPALQVQSAVNVGFSYGF